MIGASQAFEGLYGPKPIKGETTMKLYLLYYDTDTGAREEWNTFYTPVEVFASYDDREARMDFIRQQRNEDGELYNYEFHTVDTDVMTGPQITIWEE